MQDLLKRIDDRVDECIEQLAQFVRIPSVSAGADCDSAPAIQQAADFLVEHFARMHFTAQKVRRRLSHPGWMLLDASSNALSAATPARALDARRAAT